MKHIQLKYNMIQILFWLVSCAACGYIAIFLQAKGLSNTEIGIVTGGSCLLNIFLSPYLSGLMDKVKSLTIHKLLTILFLIVGILFVLVSFVPLPKVLIMVAYILVYSLNVSCVPFVSSLAMNYVQSGTQVNFGLARGLGSVSYATTAMVLGYLVDWFDPNVLAITYVLGSILFLAVLYSMPKTEIEEITETKGNKSSVGKIIKNYPTFFLLLLGFTFSFAAAVALATYLINIVESLGGSTTFYGIAVFCMAASEMPIMALTPKLMQKYNSVLLMMVAAFFYLVRNLIICFAPNLPILLIGMACQSLSYALVTGVITYYVTLHLKPEDQIMGQTMIAIMSTGLGSMIGNIFGGVLTDNFGLHAMFLFCCVLSVLGLIITWITGFKQGKKLHYPDRIIKVMEEHE